MKQKILAATVFFNVAAVALFAVYAATGNSTVLTFAITALTTAYHFDMRLLAGLITAHFAPYYHPDAACFRQRRWEKKLYRFLRVRRWRGKLPTYNPALFDRQTLTPEELARNQCAAEVGHTVIALLSYLPLLLIPVFGAPAVFLITSVFASFADMVFVIAQRYNRPALLRWIALQNSRKEEKRPTVH